MYAPQIVSYINSVLKAYLSGSQFQQGVYHGIAKQVIRTKDNHPFIVIFDNEGNDMSDFINDKYSLSVYHRMTGYTFSEEAQNQNDSFGDSARTKGLQMNMVMVVYGDRNRLKMTNEELSALMYVYFPSEIPQNIRTQLTGIEVANISPLTTNNNSAQVEQSEGIKVEVENILFTLNYVIKEKINTSCIQACDYTFETDNLCFELCASQAGSSQVLTPFLTTAGTNSYQFNALKGKTIKFVLIDNMPLVPPPSAVAQWSFNSTTGTWTYTDSVVPLITGQAVTIGYSS